MFRTTGVLYCHSGLVVKVAAMTNVQACYGEHPTVERPSNDKYAFLCVFHTLLKGKKRRSFSAEFFQHSLHPVLPKRSRKMLLFSPNYVEIMHDDSYRGRRTPLLRTPNGTPDSFWYLSPFGSPVMKFEAGCSRRIST